VLCGVFVLRVTPATYRPIDITHAQRAGVAAPIPTQASVLATLIYADLFDFPLTLDEIVRYQIGTTYSRQEIAQCVAEDPGVAPITGHDGRFYYLRGREQVCVLRDVRWRRSRRVWRRARKYIRWTARLPFVRMVAVTGALSMNNLGARPDIDLLVVARAGRVWLCRRALILQVRLARLFGDELCPNYVLSEARLGLDQQDLFTAHELAQMVPCYGSSVYRRMIAENKWAEVYLPMAFAQPTSGHMAQDDAPSIARRVFESTLSRPLFDGWEMWELRRLQQKLRPVIGSATEVVCSPDQCKGHTGLHRQSVLSRYADRLRTYGLYDTYSQFFTPQ
jgi:hypothetical protein